MHYKLHHYHQSALVLLIQTNLDRFLHCWQSWAQEIMQFRYSSKQEYNITFKHRCLLHKCQVWAVSAILQYHYDRYNIANRLYHSSHLNEISVRASKFYWLLYRHDQLAWPCITFYGEITSFVILMIQNYILPCDGRVRILYGSPTGQKLMLIPG